MRRAAAALLAAGALGAICVLPTPAAADPAETDPDLAARDADYAAGRRALLAKDWTTAVARFRKAEVRNPDSADLHNELGFAYRNLRRFDDAFRHYERAIALEPRHKGAHEYIGEAYLLVGDEANARKHLEALRAICLLPCEELKDLEAAFAQRRR